MCPSSIPAWRDHTQGRTGQGSLLQVRGWSADPPGLRGRASSGAFSACCSGGWRVAGARAGGVPRMAPGLRCGGGILPLRR